LHHDGNGKPYLQVEVFRQRFERIIFVAKTGTEGKARPSWFRYVCDEVAAAIAAGMGIEGICLYPIVNHPGWINNRHCHNGLGDCADGRASVRSPCPLGTSSSNKWRALEIIRRCAALSRELLTWGNGETARKSAEGISALENSLDQHRE
jgi:hypothetical protein